MTPTKAPLHPQHPQQSIDFDSASRHAEERIDQDELARSVAAQLAAVDAQFVGCGPVRWEQAGRVLTAVVVATSATTAAREAGLSMHQFKRVREILIRLHLVAVRPQFDRQTGRRIEDRLIVDRERLAELAAAAREQRPVRCRAPGAHLQGTYSAPPGALQGTWSAPTAQVQGTCGARVAHPANTSGDTARVYAHTRVDSRDEWSIESIESIDDRLRQWTEDEWEEIAEATRRVTKSRQFDVPAKTRRDVEFVMKMFVLVRLGVVSEHLLADSIEAVRRVARVRNPFAYLTKCCLTHASELGIPLYRELAQINLPPYLFPSRAAGGSQ
jgi:hypothetical protein